MVERHAIGTYSIFHGVRARVRWQVVWASDSVWEQKNQTSCPLVHHGAQSALRGPTHHKQQYASTWAKTFLHSPVTTPPSLGVEQENEGSTCVTKSNQTCATAERCRQNEK